MHVYIVINYCYVNILIINKYNLTYLLHDVIIYICTLKIININNNINNNKKQKLFYY